MLKFNIFKLTYGRFGGDYRVAVSQFIKLTIIVIRYGQTVIRNDSEYRENFVSKKALVL